MSDGGPAPHPTPVPQCRRQRVFRVVRRGAAASVVVSVVVGAVPPLREAALYGTTAAVLRASDRWAPDVPPFAELSSDTRIVAADGRPLATLQKEHRRPVRLADVPVPVRRAVLAAEDQNFYRHAGVDPLGLARATWRNLRHGRAQGGSTITQQLAKTNFTTGERSFDRKAEEALIASELERRFTKDALFERYLNQIYFGGRAYGLGAAAHTFFGVDPAGLSVSQAATLAGQIRAPGVDPRADPAAVLLRRDAVLANMANEGWLTDVELALAKAEALTLAPPAPSDGTAPAPHFVELVKREAQKLDVLGEDAATRLDRLAAGGYRVETTLDPATFEATTAAAQRHLGRPGDPRVATATVEPGTGAIRSLFGGADFAGHQFDQASMGARQPGSSFKPFVYLAALRAGIDPRSTFSGRSDRTIKCYGNRRVHNFENRSAGGRRGRGGSIDVDRALVQSVNVVFVDLGCEVGVDGVLRAATDAGIPDGATRAQGAIFLGGLDRGVSALTMAAAYATFAAGGIYAEPYAIARIVDAGGRVVYQREPVTRQAFRPEEVGVLNRMLQSVVKSGTGRAADIGRPVAGKTGTSEDHGDAWFVGFVPQLATAVWVGYEPRRPMWQVQGRAVSGGSFPAAIFGDVMRRAVEGSVAQPIPTVEPDVLNLRRLNPAPTWGSRPARRPWTLAAASQSARRPRR